MDYYFLIITLIDVFVLGIMCILTKYNETLNVRQRRWFICSFILIMAISVLEVVTIVVDNGASSLRWINIVANYLGFGLTPAVAVFLSTVFNTGKSTKYAFIAEGMYLLLLAVSFPFGIVFYVDQNNQYMRGDYFGIYLAVYFTSIFYLLVMTLLAAGKYQNKSKNCLYLIAAFLLVCSTIQVIFPAIHVTWLCVSLLAILYFTYCNGMWHQLDELTGLLNQKSYLNKTMTLSKDMTLIVFDVDDFKQINDNYGHLAGDQCLKEVADCIKSAYSKYGLCYRIGGDEFCVLLDSQTDMENCYQMLIEELNIRRKKLEILPYVSIGSASFVKGDNVLKVKETADNNMYRFKRERKAGLK
ncbi:MAG: GGDEF domain-containing protein [Bacillota bacterium]|nr:GGDEF domain-containing protein [Bacillota bacterium]